ncbi:pseudouridylate synthase 7 homolog isoform X2 [Corticium candelabrum]|nr:pseudouridylate synthase 7 homolog isoform X2 [Corticium candelabrum]XP_062522852.1 pseudouridylate synthase 7 homolog isoform X2 [Corticium candelabrum]XP_062522853.1 pseudouridylate synthase 7 homolog isoform X2 [Corticium candelabrum]
MTNTTPVEENDQPIVQHDLLSETDRLKLRQVADNDSNTESIQIKVCEDKAARTAFHVLIKVEFPQLESFTQTTDDGQKIICVRKQTKSQQRRRGWWPSYRGDYTHFVLYKENKDTGDAVGLLSKFLNVKASNFAYAGNKDRRAITVQRISVYRVTADKLSQLNKILRNMRVGNFTYEKEPLRLGQLWGNRFCIVLRNVAGDCDCRERSLQSLRDKGFINYFGMQRFGTYSIPTYEVGKALLHSNWATAIDLILNLKAHEVDVSTAHQLWAETKDATRTLTKMPQRCTIARQLLKGIQKHGLRDACNALSFIPRNTRMMYVHSYQSLVWNRVVSRRVQRFGLKPVVGDLVIKANLTSADTVRQKVERRVEVELLTEKTIDNYSIHDVVLPLPGFDVTFPSYESSSWYEEILTGDDITLQMLNHRVKDYALSGSYRKIVMKPVDMTWDVLSYDDKTIPLTVTDLDRLEGKSLVLDTKGGKLAAVRLEFSLPSSCYATMALREVTKTDTSAAFQTTLND